MFFVSLAWGQIIHRCYFVDDNPLELVICSRTILKPTDSKHPDDVTKHYDGVLLQLQMTKHEVYKCEKNGQRERIPEKKPSLTWLPTDLKVYN